MHPQRIILINFGYFEQDFLRKVAEAVGRELFLPVTVIEGHLDMSGYYDAGRRQYDGNQLIKAVDQTYADDSRRSIGLFDVDLFIPILTFIFGQAFLNGRAGIASTYRLGNERYGLEKNEDLMLDRFIKETIHETGHTLGLIHCRVSGCVMNPGNYVEDIDQKGTALCHTCCGSVRNLLP
jgi:archaemetzincin